MEIEWTNQSLADLGGIWEFVAEDDQVAATDLVDHIIEAVESHLSG